MADPDTSDDSTAELVGKAFVTVVIIGVLLADPLPGDIVVAPYLIGPLWGLDVEE
jgi:hypothetical protein